MHREISRNDLSNSLYLLPVLLQRLKKLLDLPYVDEKNYERVCLYLLRMAGYMSDPDDLLVRKGLCHTYIK